MGEDERLTDPRCSLSVAAARSLRRVTPRQGTPPTPGRVRRGFRYLRAKAPCPASAPKPGHPGPGRPLGVKNRHRAARYDVGKADTRDAANRTSKQVMG
jgi:hypothetical protein